jgi:hypothetical protein
MEAERREDPMKTNRLTALTAALLMLGSVGTSFGQSQYGRDPYGRSYGRQDEYGRQYGRDRWTRGMRVPAGTPLTVRLDSQISTDDMRSGDRWSGTLSQPVVFRNRVMIPAGTPVEGILTESVQGDHNNPAQVTLAVRSMDVGGGYREVNATSENIVAGSKTAQKIGAIAIGAAAGALLGHAISDEHGGLIGGLLGGVAGYGATRHAYRTLVLRPGTEITFTTIEDMVALR